MGNPPDSTLELKVKTICHVGNRICGAGEILSVTLHDALPAVVRGDAEIIFDLPNVAPSLPPEGTSLAEAYCAHANALIEAAHPSLGNEPLPEMTKIHVARYAEEPRWYGIPRLRKEREASLSVTLDPEGDAKRRRARQMTQPSTERRFKVACAEYYANIAIYRYLRRLREEELTAYGVWEGDLAQQRRVPIATEWWNRELLLDLRRNEIRELTGAKRGIGERRFSGLVVVEKREASFYGGGADDDPQVRTAEALVHDDAPVRQPGRPSRRGEIDKAIAELHREYAFKGCRKRTEMVVKVCERVWENAGEVDTRPPKGLKYETIRVRLIEAGLLNTINP